MVTKISSLTEVDANQDVWETYATICARLGISWKASEVKNVNLKVPFAIRGSLTKQKNA